MFCLPTKYKIITTELKITLYVECKLNMAIIAKNVWIEQTILLNIDREKIIDLQNKMLVSDI